MKFSSGKTLRIILIHNVLSAFVHNFSADLRISFIVEPDGAISNISIKRDIGYGCGAEAMRVVKSMPKWKPGKQKGKTVRTQLMLPVSFKLS